MKLHTRLIALARRLAFFLAVILTAACGSPPVELLPVPSSAQDANLPDFTATVSPTSRWSGLLLMSPAPFTTPLPDETWTPIDGTYAKIDHSTPQWWACRRCADYRPAGGIWKLQFSQGTMRIYYDVTGWRSLASYTVSGDRLYLYNDPICPQAVGEYTWRLEDRWGLQDRALHLDVVEDTCSIALRGENLSGMAWDSCQPPSLMTGASDHWHKSPGCETSLKPPATAVPPALSVSVSVHPGYARRFGRAPDLFVDANAAGDSLPQGILVAHSSDSIPYGLNRVLWGEGSSVEVATELPFAAMGVQVYGAHTIGWARLLFDEQEVWRGDTAAIGSHQDFFGGYLEVSGYPPGRHTLRIESMGFDYHPVTIAFFGFSTETGVGLEK